MPKRWRCRCSPRTLLVIQRTETREEEFQGRCSAAVVGVRGPSSLFRGLKRFAGYVQQDAVRRLEARSADPPRYSED